MIPHRLFLTTILLFSGLYFFKGAFAQDTLFYPSGEIQVVQLLSINKSSGLITYKSDGKTSVRAMSSLSSFTNHTNVPISEYQLPVKSSEEQNQSSTLPQKLPRKVHGFDYGHWSFGLNILTPLTLKRAPEMLRQRIYLLYKFNNHLGVRLPATFGLNNGFPKHYYLANFQIHYEFGLEPVFYFNDSWKSTGYFSFGAHLGKNSTYNSSAVSPDEIQGPDHSFYRIEFNIGFQHNFAKHFAFNLETGLNLNNTTTTWYYQSSQDQDYQRIQLQFHAHLIYRFGGKLKERT